MSPGVSNESPSEGGAVPAPTLLPMEALPSEAALLDRAGRVVEVNTAWRSLFRGALPESEAFLPGRVFLEDCGLCSRHLGTPPPPAHCVEEMLAVLGGTLPLTTGDLPFRVGTDPRHFRVLARSLGAGGTLLQLVDISEQRLAEMALRESVRELSDFKSALDCHAIVAVTNASGRITYVNDLFCSISGYTREELLGQDHRLLNSGRHPSSFFREMWKTIGRGEVWRGDICNLSKAGHLYWVATTIVPFLGRDGKPSQYVAIRTDITERRAAEVRIAEQAALIDEARDAILVRGLDQKVLFWSKGAERMYGWTAAEAVGHPGDQLLQADPDRFHAADAAVRSNGEWSGEIPVASKSGQRLMVDSRWTLLRDGDGRPKSILAIDTDVTERKKLEQQFLRAQRMESIGTLAGGIAHDLNNVLAPILMSIELLRLELERQEKDEILDTIESSARRGAEMVGQVLSFARGVEGRRLSVQVKHLVRDVAKIASETFPRNIEIRAEVPSNLPPVLGDPTQIHQVLLNLSVNARDAMPRGGTLTFSAQNVVLDDQYAGLSPEAKPGRHVLIQVEDTGTGIAPEILEKVFDPFFTTKEPGKGTGLGLSTSLAIVRSHGGFIRAYSEPGTGSRFRVYLPATESTTELAPVADVVLPRGNGEVVLVVDDEASVRHITRQTLEAFGYRVILAGDGAEALAVYASRRTEIALVLTDMMMPVMDGPATIRVLTKMDPSVRIIAASGLTANGSVTRVANSGVRHFLPKPYTAETLLRTVREVLDAPVVS
jgi:two-component system, cell cycle sensor histidine kinase and response regulator CckA